MPLNLAEFVVDVIDVGCVHTGSDCSMTALDSFFQVDVVAELLDIEEADELTSVFTYPGATEDAED